MEAYLIPWIITIIKMVIMVPIALVACALVDNYLPENIKEKIVNFLKEDSDE